MRATFGRFVLDAGQRRLLDGGELVTLSPKAFDVLQLLIERSPNVVDKDAIVAAVWGDAEPSDASLTNVVTEIRKALGDSVDNPAFVRTVHRKGYAFCGQVRVKDREVVAGRPPGAKYWLLSDGRRFILEAEETIIGRDPACGVWLNAPSITWHHAKLTLRGGTAVIQDLNSTNGTFVRGGRVTGPTAISAGETVHFSDVAVVFGTSSTAARVPTRPLRGLQRDKP